MLELREVYKGYEGQPLLRGVSFEVHREETVCLLGPSGSGKSTILQLISGLQLPEGGSILWDGVNLVATPPHLRDFGLVFQDYALFPHLDVFDNVAFGPRMRGWSADETSHRVGEALELVDLVGFGRRSVTELSGGEQQRVALARALAPRPRLLMFDEPMGALDRNLREQLTDQLRQVLQRARVPSIYVTHDQEEAFRIAQRVLLLHGGRIVRSGAPEDIWAHPGSPWVARFLGVGSVVRGRITMDCQRAESEYGPLRLDCNHKHRAGEHVQMLIRPTPASHGSTLQGRVRETIFLHDRYRVVLVGGLFLEMESPPVIGDTIRVTVKPECLGTESGD
ncbi:MAG: ABC transporter ATP-binding protein [Anaerolineales bacterium]